MRSSRVFGPALAMLLAALAAPACGLIAGLGDYRLASTGGGHGGAGGHDGGATTGTGGTGGGGGALVGTRISGGTYHACIVKDDGALRCWGTNLAGQLGVSPGLSSLAETPIAVPGVPLARQVAAGATHTCAILPPDDHVSCWGDDSSGAVGVSPMVGIHPASTLAIRAARIAAGADFTCVVTPPDDGGQVECWGNDFNGSLGHDLGSTAMPGPTSPPVTGATALATCSGCATACAIVAGEAWCWGGAPTLSKPVKVTGAQGVAAVAVGSSNDSGTITGEFVFLLSTSGDVTYTQRAGQGAFDAPKPYATGVAQISVSNHVVALTTQGDVAFGDPFSEGAAPPLLAVPFMPAAPVLELGAGVYFDCLRTKTGALCAGLDSVGQLGDGRAEIVVRATQVSAAVTTMATGEECTTLQHADGSFEAFGECQVYDGDFAGARFSPAPVPQLPPTTTFFRTGPALAPTDPTDRRGYFHDSIAGFFEIVDQGMVAPNIPSATDYVHAVLTPDWDLALHQGGPLALTALTSDANAHGLFGASAPAVGSTLPFPAYAGFAAASGASHVCAWTTAGALSCWGENGDRQSDPKAPTTSDVTAPVAVAIGNVTAVAVGERHTCALASGTVYCWGDDSALQLGATPPVIGLGGTYQVALPHAATLLAGGLRFTCAYVDADQRVYCWGQNDYGECGNGTRLHPAAPQPVKGLAGPVVELTAGHDSMCARLSTSEVYCWGDSPGGQVGSGAHDASADLQPVLDL